MFAFRSLLDRPSHRPPVMGGDTHTHTHTHTHLHTQQHTKDIFFVSVCGYDEGESVCGTVCGSPRSLCVCVCVCVSHTVKNVDSPKSAIFSSASGELSDSSRFSGLMSLCVCVEDTVQRNTQYSTVQYSIAVRYNKQYSTVQCSTVQYTVQYSTA